MGVVILAQTLVYALAGAGKAYIHMDEAYSLGLAQYDRVEIQENEDFYNHWHTKEYFQDYLAVQEDEQWDFGPVWENQKNDVHPPLYYFFLRLAMETSLGEFSKWPGIILNMIFAVGNTVLMYLILKKLLAGRRVKAKALILTAVAGLTLAAISAVVYIRMYMLLTLFVTLGVWLHLKLYESKRLEPGLLAAIGVTAVLGVLTQYYYVFFLAPMWIVMAVKYGRARRWKELGVYTGMLLAAGVIVLLIWPYAIQHMFFGYRGQGVLASFLNLPQLLGQIWEYVQIVDYYDFGWTLVMWVAVGVGVVASCKMSKGCCSAKPGQNHGPEGDSILRGLPNPKTDYATLRLQAQKWNIIVWPTLGYFLMAAAVSPFIELRYIMPVCGMMVVMVVAGASWALGRVLTEKKRDVLVVAMLGIMIVAAPVQLAMGTMRIELLYRDKEALMQELAENADVPALYFITTENNRFLDNILPFATLEESYLALDVEPTEVKVGEILEGKDLSKGLYLFVSGVMDAERTLQAVKMATGLERAEFVQGVNTCDIYYLE